MGRSWMVALLLPGLVLTTGASFAAEEPPLAPGALVRVTAPDVSRKRITGTLVEATERQIVLRLSPSESRAIPRDAIERLEWSEGRRGHALAGGLVGAALGGAAILALSRGLCEASQCEGAPASAYLLGMGIGALPGAGIGALIRTEDWKEAPRASLRLGLAPVPQGVGMSLTLRF